MDLCHRDGLRRRWQAQKKQIKLLNLRSIMKVSYKKLQTYFKDQLPSPEKLADAFSFHFAEVEGIEKSGDDFILDIKVLPDREYSKSYEGIAKEIYAILGIRNNITEVRSDAGSFFDVEIKKINAALGMEIPKSEIVAILRRMNISVEDKGDILALIVPAERKDLKDWRDIPEEIGRIYGYDKIPTKISIMRNPDSGPDKIFYYSEKIKNILIERGFSEVYTYSLTSNGDYKIEKSAALGKNFLRGNLASGIEKSLDLNYKNAEFLGLDEIKIFEIGKVFPKTGEHTSLAIGIKNVKKRDTSANEKIRNTREHLLVALGSNLQTLCSVDDTGGLLIMGGKQIGVINNVDGVLELNLDEFIAPLSQPKSYKDLDFKKTKELVYQTFSVYPYIVRDIALWASKGDEEEIRRTLEEEGGELMVKIYLFDYFEKDGEISYAFRIVFQAMDRTLEEKEINEIMERVYKKIKDKGWAVR